MYCRHSTPEEIGALYRVNISIKSLELPINSFGFVKYEAKNELINSE